MELGWNESKGACWNAFGVTKTLVPMQRVGNVVCFTHLSLSLYYLCIFFNMPHKEMLEDTVLLVNLWKLQWDGEPLSQSFFSCNSLSGSQMPNTFLKVRIIIKNPLLLKAQTKNDVFATEELLVLDPDNCIC